MKPMQLASALVILMAVPLAHAQQSPCLPDPLDPAVAVPQPVYESAIAQYSRAPKHGGVTPDKTWREANDVVAGGTGHTAHGAPQQPAPAPPPTKPAPAASGHKHH